MMLDGFGMFGGGGPDGGPVGLARSRDPRFAYAQALANSALDTSTPIRSNLQGFGQLAKAAVSALGMHKLEDEYKTREGDYARSIANALQAGQGTPAETKTYDTPDDSGNPTTINWNPVAPDPQRMTNILASNRDTAPMAMQMAMQRMQAEQALQNHLRLAQGMIPINVQGAQAMIPAKVDEANALIGPKVNEATQMIAPQVAQQNALTPGLVNRAGGIAGATAAAELPFAGPRAQAMATGTLAAQNAPTPVTLPGQTGPISLPAAAVAPAMAKTVEQQAAQPGKNTETEEKMADDFRAEPTVVAYKKILPTWNSMVDAAKNNTRASDLNLVYGLATIFDPGSAVREGEQVLVRDTAALPDWLVGQINRVNGGAGLQPDTRNAIMAEAGSRVQNWNSQFEQTATQYRDIAGRRGLKAENVIISPGAMSAHAPLSGGITQSQYDALPSGSTYTAPDGSQRTKR